MLFANNSSNSDAKRTLRIVSKMLPLIHLILKLGFEKSLDLRRATIKSHRTIQETESLAEPLSAEIYFLEGVWIFWDFALLVAAGCGPNVDED